MNKTTAALIAGLSVLAAGGLGAQNGPQRPSTGLWYLLLRKPGFTPPGPAIAAAWGVLETLLAASGYRLLRAPPSTSRDVALGGWGLSLAGLAGYPWLFFGRKRLAASALASGAMLAAAAITAGAARKADRPAEAMTLPLIAWLAFATALAEELWRRNPKLSRD
jgi:tryptophan-rich sensory protein